jgi:hypothetical protein
MCITARLKFQKFFKYFFTGETLPFTAFVKPPEGQGAFYVKHGFSGLHAGPGDGAVLKMVRIKGPAQVRLAYARCKQNKKP